MITIATTIRVHVGMDCSLTTAYFGSVQFSCYYVRYVPESKPFDHA
jgi:hypothetical protein